MKIKRIIITTLATMAVLSTVAQNGPRWSPAGNTASIGDFIGTLNAFPLTVKTNNISRFTFDTNGDFIFNSLANGNANRLMSLDANGKLSALSGTAVTNLFNSNGVGVLQKTGNDYFLPTGNLGIGIAPSPGFKLDVIGDARISNNLYVGGGIVITDQVQAATQVKGWDVKVDNDLNVTGSSSFTGAVSFKGAVSSLQGFDLGNGYTLKTVTSSNPANGPIISIGGPGGPGFQDDPKPCVVPANPTGWFSFGKSGFYTSQGTAPNTAQLIGLVDQTTGNAFIESSGTINGSSNSELFINGKCNNNTRINWNSGQTFVGNYLFAKQIVEIGTGTTSPVYNLRVNRSNVGTGISVNMVASVPSSARAFEVTKTVGNNPQTEYFTIEGDGATTIKSTSTDAFKVLNTTNGQTGFVTKNNGATQINSTASDAFVVLNNTNNTNAFTVKNNGYVKIGTQTQTGIHNDALLTVFGKMVSTSCYIRTTQWADYVFANDYKVPNLYDVEKFYLANKHLPEIPSEKEVIENGIDVAEMNKLLLKKIEEMTILMVKQQKQIDLLEAKIK